MKYVPSIARDVVQTQPGKAALAQLRKHRWFAIFVLLPVLLAFIHYGFIASDQYVSESRFVIKSPGQRQTQLSSLANLIQTTGLSAGQEQTNEVLDYVRSRNALADLERQIDVRRKFASTDIDAFSRFPQIFRQDRFENLYKYYGKMIDGRLDNETGAVVLIVRAFSAKDAHEINARLLNLSEALVNRLNDRARSRGISEAQRRVDEAETRVRNARVALNTYRNSEQLIDPAKQAIGVVEIGNKLITERAALQAQLQVMERAAPRNPSIPTLRSRIAAADRAIATQDARVVGGPAGIASKLGRYENLMVEQEFATEMLNVANASLEQARTEAQKQQFYLERVVEPSVPDLPLYPERIRSIIVTGATALCLYLVGWMLVVGILEHAPED
jgi:capsular polysaccharide transport system permease protein